MKNIKYILLLTLAISFTSCDVDEILNPNSPTVESFESGATLADLKLLAHGLQAVQRIDANFHYWTISGVGREYFDMRGTDPRYTSELLGSNGSSLDNNGFLTTRTYFGRYRTIRNAILLKTAVANTVASLSTSQTNAILGYANTLIGQEMLMEANRQYENGIRLDVDDINALGPFTNSYQESLNGIATVLDDAYAQLSNTSAEDMVFTLEGFDLPVTDTEAVGQYNRALRARVALYQNDNAGALSALANSFLNPDGSMDMGVYYVYGGATGNDLTNPYFYVPGVDNYMAHESFVDDAEAGDGRLSKVTDQGADVSIDNLSSPYLVTLYASNSSPAAMLRNEELILIYAEAMVGSDNDAAITAINKVRTAAGLADYAGGTDDASVMDQILHERRYSLFGEAHRWVDMRRWGRLGELPLDRPGDQVHIQFPRPANEN